MMKNKAIFLIITIAAFVGFIQSCNSKSDEIFPEISVSKPMNGNIFDNGDTIIFQALFSDDSKLMYAEVILVDKANIPKLPVFTITPDKNPFSITGSYIISDPLLPGGIYQLRFRTSDGTNVTNNFIDIQIHELDQQLLYPLIVTHPETNRWEAYSLTAANIWKEIYSYTGDYSGSAVNSAASQFYICGIVQSDLTAVKLPEGKFLWSVKPEIHQSQRWFEGITFDNTMLYVSCAEGNIRGYDNTGSEIYKTETYPNASPSHSAKTKNFVVGYFEDNFSKSKSLVAFHNEGGKMIQDKYIFTEVVGLHHIENDNILVFSNSTGQSEISLYDGTANTFSLLHLFYDGTFFETAVIDKNNFLISGSTGLYWFRMNTNSLISFSTEMINCQVAFDPLTQLIYASNSSILKVIDFPSGSTVESYSVPGPAVDLHLVYNK